MARLAWVSLNVGTTPSPQIQGMELSSFRGLQPLLDQPQLFDGFCWMARQKQW